MNTTSGCSRSRATATGRAGAGFFLRAITAEANGEKARRILDLYRADRAWIMDATRSHHPAAALDWFFSRPVFKSSDFVLAAGIPKATANRILSVARAGGRLADLRPASGRRPAILGYPALLDIADA